MSKSRALQVMNSSLLAFDVSTSSPFAFFTASHRHAQFHCLSAASHGLSMSYACIPCHTRIYLQIFLFRMTSPGFVQEPVQSSPRLVK